MQSKRARRRARGLERVKKIIRSLTGTFSFEYTHIVVRRGSVQAFCLPSGFLLNLSTPGLYSL